MNNMGLQGAGFDHLPQAARAVTQIWDPLPGSSQAGMLLQGRTRGLCWDPILGSLHPPTPVFSAFHLLIDGLIQQKSKILPEKSLPYLALAVPWPGAEILFDLDLFS